MKFNTSFTKQKCDEFHIKKCQIVIYLVLALILTGCKKSPQILTNIILDNKSITIVPNDELSANAWNTPEVTYNGKSCHKYPILYKGITIGTKYDDVIKAFDIKEGYAIVDREIDTSGDGCTDIVHEEYKNLDFFKKEKVLDADFIFGYEQKDGNWNAIAYKQLEEISKDREKASNILLFQIDICGSQMTEEKVDVGCVIQFTVSYLG